MALTVTSSTNGTQLFAVGSSVARVSFFNGQLLTQRDLQAEQRFHLLLQRIVQREAFGTGTVAGLEVTKQLDTVTLPRGVFVQPGLAFDPDGRQLLLEQVVSVDVADDPLPLPATPFAFDLADGASRTDLAEAIRGRFLVAFGEDDLTQLAVDLTGAGLLSASDLADYLAADTNTDTIRAKIEQLPDQPADLVPPLLLREWLYNELVGQTFIGVKFREAGTNPSPALLEAACCGTKPCFPTRTQEALFVVTSSAAFPAIDDPFTTLKLCLDTQFFAQIDTAGSTPAQVDVRAALCSCLLGAWRGNPPLDTGCGDVDAPVVPLAQVFWSRFVVTGSTTQILNVNNCNRPLAPGGPAIRALLESLTGWATPATLPPRVVAMEPPNGEVLSTATTDNLTLTATFNAELSGSVDPNDAWQLVFYASEDLAPVVFDGSSGSGPGSSTFTAQYLTVPVTGATQFELAFTGGTGFEQGTYVFRLMNGGTAIIPSSGTALRADATTAQVDGEPNPPAAVPSGDGLSGGPFESRFVVRG